MHLGMWTQWDRINTSDQECRTSEAYFMALIVATSCFLMAIIVNISFTSLLQLQDRLSDANGRRPNNVRLFINTLLPIFLFHRPLFSRVEIWGRRSSASVDRSNGWIAMIFSSLQAGIVRAYIPRGDHTRRSFQIISYQRFNRIDISSFRSPPACRASYLKKYM